ncbi:MAG: Oxoglutarate dehydrogenase inhibitor [Verrucomicrobiota bacterium]|jgi:hypothetical protein
MTKLTLQGVTHPGTLELADGMVSLGRNPTNDLRIPDPTVSSFHCEIITADETVLVRDLSSTNGTFINNKSIRESFLRPGETLKLGEAELRLVATPLPREETSPPPEPAPPAAPQHEYPCVNHPNSQGVARCTACHKVFCQTCIKPVGLRGGQSRLFCPSCAQPCEPIAPSTAPPPKKSLLGRLTQTIRIRLGQR